ncbi:hypothetical protein Tco_1331715 [Tanacetum coccineum]
MGATSIPPSISFQPPTTYWLPPDQHPKSEIKTPSEPTSYTIDLTHSHTHKSQVIFKPLMIHFAAVLGDCLLLFWCVICYYPNVPVLPLQVPVCCSTRGLLAAGSLFGLVLIFGLLQPYKLSLIDDVCGSSKSVIRIGWFLDSGATVPLGGIRGDFLDYRTIERGQEIMVGESRSNVIGKGTINLAISIVSG